MAAAATIGWLLTGCAQIQEEACKSRLRDHFAVLTALQQSAPETLAEARTVTQQVRTVAASAPLDGCSSAARVAVAEIVTATDDVSRALSNENVLVGGLFSLFNAEAWSPAHQQIKAAVGRLETAFRMLDHATE